MGLQVMNRGFGARHDLMIGKGSTQCFIQRYNIKGDARLVNLQSSMGGIPGIEATFIGSD